MHVVLWDNASHDGSADAVAERFPQVELVRSAENLGFAKANNEAISDAETEFVLLLNPDTETHPKAIENLLNFAKANPQAGLVGGRTVFPDGSLNIASCWRKMTIWSLFCRAVGLSRIWPGSNLFNPEVIGNWKRDSVRHVDIVAGCLLMTRKSVWDELGGFREKYFMYGEEADLCLRASKAGYRPMITPEAQIMHMVGASYSADGPRFVKVLRGRSTLIRDHWRSWEKPIGFFLLWFWSALQMAIAQIRALLRPDGSHQKAKWSEVWARRKEWLQGY